MNNLLQKLYKTNTATTDELSLLLSNNDINAELFSLANKTRIDNAGEKIHLRALIEFSNICKCYCKYCGLRCENKHIERYRLNKTSIISMAKSAKESGFKTIVLQSGEDSFFTTDILKDIISEIKTFNLAVTLSIGEKSFSEYQAYKEAGADRYLLRIETTDKNLYKNMHPNMDINNRFRCLDYLKKLNYEVGSGFLVGLPNQTIESIANDLLFLKKTNVDMAGIGPFIPNPDTPLAKADGNNFMLSLKTMALMRLLLPNINIPATTAMETLHQNGRILALQSGANVVMPNHTIQNAKEKYLIYPNKNTKESSANIINQLKEKGFIFSNDFGTSKAWLQRQKG